jgi:hypothetical protein
MAAQLIMDLPSREDGGSATPATGRPQGVVPVDPAWNDFGTRHADWLGRWPQINPVYRLVEPAIARLEQPRLGRPPLLDHQAAVAERDLDCLCRQRNAVGFLDGCPIVYRFLASPSLRPPRPR